MMAADRVATGAVATLSAAIIGAIVLLYLGTG